jgi:hypothetical protein
VGTLHAVEFVNTFAYYFEVGYIIHTWRGASSFVLVLARWKRKMENLILL